MMSNGAFFIVTGILALVQVVFLPGFLAVHFLKVGGSFLKRLIVGFALSLMINYWILFIFALGHIYNIFALLIILIIEICIFCYIYRKTIADLGGRTLSEMSVACLQKIKDVCDDFRQWILDEFSDKETNLFKLVILILITATFAYLSYLFISNIGSIFQLWDPIVSWNRWALEWSMNTLPKNTWEYPQLIPLNWSVFYVLMGTPLQYFPKMIMPLFPIGIALTFLATGIRKKSWGYFSAIPFAILLMRLLNGSAIMATEGYVDTAVAFFATLSIICLMWSDEKSSSKIIKENLLLGCLFALGAAMTKQAGLFIALVYPFLAWFLIVRKNPELRKNILKYICFYAALLILLIGPFYIYKEISIGAHTDSSVVPTIANMIYGGGKNPLSILLGALYYLVAKTYGLSLFYLFFLIVACRDKKFRYIITFVVIPYTLIWALFFSYDTRNLTLAMPFWGLVAGIGLEQLFIYKRNASIKYVEQIRLGYCILILFAIFLVLSPSLSKKISGRHTLDERSLYDGELGILLSNYFENHPQDGKIYSNFPILYFLPETKNRIYSPEGGYSPNVDDFGHYSENNNKPEAAYILAANYTAKPIMDDIEKNIRDGRYSLIFRHNGFILIKTNNK